MTEGHTSHFVCCASLIMCLYLLQPFSQRGVIEEPRTAANQLIDR